MELSIRNYILILLLILSLVVLYSHCSKTSGQASALFNIELTNDDNFLKWTKTDSLSFEFINNLFYNVQIRDTNDLLNVWNNPLDTSFNRAILQNYPTTENTSVRLKALYWIYCVYYVHRPAKYALLHDKVHNTMLFDLTCVSNPTSKYNGSAFCFVKNDEGKNELLEIENRYKEMLEAINKTGIEKIRESDMAPLDTTRYIWVEFN